MTEVVSERSSLERWQRRLLPGELVEPPGARRSARDWAVDSTLFLVAIAVGVLGLVPTWADHSTVQKVADLVLGTAACLALWLRRSRPVGVAVLTVASGAVSALAGGAAVIAVFNVAVRGTRRALIGVAALSLASIAIYPLLYPSAGTFASEFLVGFVILAVAVGWGLFARVRRELVLSLRERAERLEAEQRLQLERARDAERRRIAREMHDVLAHRLSLLSVHAGALEFRPDASPEEVSEATGVIRATAQAALQELRDVIGILREDSGDALLQPPQPTFAQIAGLVEESRAAGMSVRLRDELGEGVEVPAALGRTAYRVVQEGLTNARKHAPGAAVDVNISAGAATGLLVVVVSRPATVAVAVAPDLRAAGAGTGLVGLAERVALAGGRLEHGPDAAGDFVLRASLPWPA
jgi:signal transduction histidine kinase